MIRYEGMNVTFIRRDAVEVFRFIWRNRAVLGVHPDAHTQVLSVRTSLKPVPNDFPREQTAVEYLQTVTVHARRLASIGVRKPLGMPDDTVVTLYGGGTLILDERGLLQYAITTSVMNQSRQTRQLAYAWEFRPGPGHEMRAGPLGAWPVEITMPSPSTPGGLRKKARR